MIHPSIPQHTSPYHVILNSPPNVTTSTTDLSTTSEPIHPQSQIKHCGYSEDEESLSPADKTRRKEAKHEKFRSENGTMAN